MARPSGDTDILLKPVVLSCIILIYPLSYGPLLSLLLCLVPSQSLAHEPSVVPEPRQESASVSSVQPLPISSPEPVHILSQSLVTESPESSMIPVSTPTSVPESMLPVSAEIPVARDDLTCSTTNTVSDLVPTSNNPIQRDRIVTRSQHNIFKPKKIFTATKHDLQENLEPSTINQAFKIPHWRDACSAEFDALMNNGTWTLVPRQANTNLVGCKWLFRIKRNPDGSVARYKARLVAKGFTQTPGLDFKETFAPVVKPQTIKVVLTLALAQGWSLHQMDVNNAFLQGKLTEDVYMQQPPGFIHAEFPQHVCKLKKAIYGLRQAPRAWHDSLKAFVLSVGFCTSLSDPS
ncbi:hypothetical protein L195_g039111, partial [Trifolium pratense]